MKDLRIYAFALAISMVVITSGMGQAKENSQVLTSTTDPKGTPHQVSLGITRPGTAKCISAVGGTQPPPACNINNQIVTKNNSIGVSGTVTLTCAGKPPLTCQAKVDW
jgi:hypothetical protein